MHVDSLQKGQNIHEKGKDRKVGDLLIAKKHKNSSRRNRGIGYSWKIVCKRCKAAKK